MPRNAIYRWQSKLGEVDYRLDIIPADSAYLDSPTIIGIDVLAITEVGKLQSQVSDKLPPGSFLGRFLKLTFDLEKLDSDFKRYLLNPTLDDTYSEITKTYEQNDSGVTPGFTATVLLSNLFRLYKWEGGFDGEFVEVFLGIQKYNSEVEVELSVSGESFTIELQDYCKFLLEMLTTEQVAMQMWARAKANFITHKADDKAVYLQWNDAGVKGYRGASPLFKEMAYFLKFDDLYLTIRSLLNTLSNYYEREMNYNYIHSINSFLSNLTLYLRDDSSSNPLARAGTAVSGQLYFIAGIGEKQYESGVLVTTLPTYDELLYGALVDAEGAFNIVSYENVFDFFKAATEAYLCKLSARHEKIGTDGRVIEFLPLNSSAIEKSISDRELEEMSLKTADSAILYAASQWNDAYDYDNAEFKRTKQGHTNDTGFEVVSLFHNVVPNLDPEREWFFPVYPFMYNLNFRPELIYYFDTINEVLVKVHEDIAFNLGNQLHQYNTPSDYYFRGRWVSLSAWNTFPNVRANLNFMQVDGSHLLASLPKAYLHLFSKQMYNTKITLAGRYEAGQTLKITIAGDDFESSLSVLLRGDAERYAVILKSDYDFEDDKSELEVLL